MDETMVTWGDGKALMADLPQPPRALAQGEADQAQGGILIGLLRGEFGGGGGARRMSVPEAPERLALSE
jgi:hypothetical protein